MVFEDEVITLNIDDAIIRGIDGQAIAVSVKAGAEAVHAAIIPELGLGVALKIDDGTKRASEVAMANILAFLGVLDPSQPSPMSSFFEAPIINTLNDTVGAVRMADGWAAG